jgi:hypothetical protein
MPYSGFTPDLMGSAVAKNDDFARHYITKPVFSLQQSGLLCLAICKPKLLMAKIRREGRIRQNISQMQIKFWRVDSRRSEVNHLRSSCRPGKFCDSIYNIENVLRFVGEI